ncbi:MAG: PA2778 family cysteine peptidase, partial [Xanthomonadales bacterium]|nr:PA2778 family cysteine peptidase [Xanthomonadales bacterium]
MLPAALSACAINPPLDLEEAAGPEPVELSQVPFHPQQEYHCGPATLLTVLQASGVEKASYDGLVDRVFVPGLEGSLQTEMTAAAREYGRVAYLLPPDPAAVFDELEAGRPVLVLLNQGVRSVPFWHYAVVIGVDPRDDRVLMRSGDDPRRAERADRWLRQWDWAGRWAMMLLQPGELPASPDRNRLLEATAAFDATGTPQARLAAWQAVLERYPDAPVAALGVANALHAAGDLAGAEAVYRRMLARWPDHAAARINLAETLVV